MDPVVSMEPVVIRDPASGSMACVAPQVGFNCYQFEARVEGRTVDVLHADPGFGKGHLPPTKWGIPILFPFPNRIRHGRYTWEGRQYEMTPDQVPFDPPQINAIHGFCLDRPWRVTQQGEKFVEGEFQLSRDAPDRRPLWPADFILQVRYEVHEAALVMKVRIANPDSRPLPWGFGTHPYFRVPLSPESRTRDCIIQAPAPQLWELIDCLPTGARCPVSPEKDLREGLVYDQLQMDDILTGLTPPAQGLECQIMDQTAGVQVVQRCDSIFRELVAFTPPHREAICLEPYTCITDAINLQTQGIDAGWRTLPPGADLMTWIEIRAEPVLA